MYTSLVMHTDGNHIFYTFCCHIFPFSSFKTNYSQKTIFRPIYNTHEQNYHGLLTLQTSSLFHFNVMLIESNHLQDLFEFRFSLIRKV